MECGIEFKNQVGGFLPPLFILSSLIEFWTYFSQIILKLYPHQAHMHIVAQAVRTTHVARTVQ